METDIARLSLKAPLVYLPGEESDPFSYRGGPDEEKLFCFELDPVQARSFEPQPDRLIKALLFQGKAPGGQPGETTCILPQGNYLFIQKRELLDGEAILSLAAEIQQEGLWQRLIPGEKLYLRYLYEDESWVTQLFRPYTEKS